VPSGSRVEAYIDMNHKQTEGATELLSGTDINLEPDDAWEFAISFGNESAGLYRSGSIKPRLIGQYGPGKYTVAIPRSVLRGNPLNWGYQALILNKDVTGAFKLGDFLCADDKTRQGFLKKHLSIYLPYEKMVQ